MAGVAVFAFLPLLPVFASVVTTDFFIVSEEDDPLVEDVYVASTSGFVEGFIDGDLFIFTGDLTIAGTVTGTVTAMSSGTVRVTPTGVVEGSLRGTARQVAVDGTIGDDMAVAALTTTIGSSATIGRDVIGFGVDLDVAGSVGRDVRGRVVNVIVSGSVGNDLDMTMSRLVITETATIGGDVLYRSAGDASISPDAEISGQIVALPVQASFIYGIILLLANIVSLLAFLVIGFVTLWLFRNTSAAAVGAAARKPLRSIVVGLIAIVVAPVLVVLFAVTLVGLPLAGALLVAILLGLVVGPVPAVTALGNFVLRHRGGLFGAFLLGALIWRLTIWFFPLVGGVVSWVAGLAFLVGLVWGVGAWLVGGWELRRGEAQSLSLLPPAMVVHEEDVPPGWEFPLPPTGVDASAEDESSVGAEPTLDEEAIPDPVPFANDEPSEQEQDEPKPDDWGLPG